jgi:hypothetical protein
MSDWMARSNAQDEKTTCASCYIKLDYQDMTWIEGCFEYICKACFLNLEMEDSENDE